MTLYPLRHFFLTSALLAPFAAASALVQQRGRATPAAGAAQHPVASEALRGMRYRHIGPVGNRVTAVVGIPGDFNTYYVGAASGGIWKTTDAGTNWASIFDGFPVQSIGALAIAPADANVVWAGTGEAFIRSHISLGDGIYRSTDAGRSWMKMGLDSTGRIGRVLIHPQDPDVVYVCALGHAYGPQPDRGVFRTLDGGRSWAKILFVNDSTGCGDLAMDPQNPRVLYAGMWQIEIHTWGRESGGLGSGLYVTRDGGATWTRLTGRGLPAKPVGKIALAVARTNPNRIFALIETGDGAPWNGRETERGKLWRSDDGGHNWRLISYDRNLGGRTHYYFRFAISPSNENEAYFLTAGYAVSTDGGENAAMQGGQASPGGDNHDMWIDPTNANRMAVANDGGVSISVNRGRTWERIQLPIAQMYHVEVDNAIPYNVMGNRQDGPSTRGPSNSKYGGFGGGSIPRGDWHPVGGGESGWATPDPQDPNIIWSSASGSGSVGGIVVRFDARTRHSRNVEVWPVAVNGSPAGDIKYRFIWTFPVHISPHDRNKLYVGSQHVHQTTDAGQSWQEISPDLTRNDKSRQGFSGGLTGDNIGVEYFGTLFAIRESRLKLGLIWTGSNDGRVHVTQDGGKSWDDVTSNIGGMPTLGTISNIEPSRYDANTAYLTVDGHQINDRRTWVYRTTDLGKTWRKISNGIPQGPLSYAHVVIEDPVRRGLLYLGTENALYFSLDSGENWQPLQLNLPAAPVYWLTVQEHFNDLVVSTYGRGFWILDDLSALQQLTGDIAEKTVHLFTPRPAYRFQFKSTPMAPSHDMTVGENPPYGASINYWLKGPPSGDVTLSILDAAGRTVRTMPGTRNAGLNRVYWDLRGEPSREVRLRTSPMYAPEISLGPQGWRPPPNAPRVAILMPPGTYSVRLTAGGETQTQQLVVRKDPNSGGSEEEIREQVAALFAVHDNVNAVADMINEIELLRGQLVALRQTLADDPATADVRGAADLLEQKFIAVEEHLIQLRVTGRGQDGVRFPQKLSSQIPYLFNGMASGDFRPTAQHGTVQKMFAEETRAHRSRLDALLANDLEQFNRRLNQRGLQGIIRRGTAVS
ncbi:MAG: VPS10 domain-containing protein [Gemmatimonadaceae bacterium]